MEKVLKKYWKKNIGYTIPKKHLRIKEQPRIYDIFNFFERRSSSKFLSAFF